MSNTLTAVLVVSLQLTHLATESLGRFSGRTSRRQLNDVLLIVNPAADRGAAGRRWQDHKRRLRAAGLSFDAELTSRPGEATEMARGAVKAGRPIVGVGGVSG